MDQNTKKFDFEQFDGKQVLDQIEADVKQKGSLDITELANDASGHSPLLTSITEVVGDTPFAWVMKASYKEQIKEVRVKLNPDILLAKLPTAMSEKIKALAVHIRRTKVSAKNPEFMAFKQAICSELVKAILVASNGQVQLSWDDEGFGTDFLFTHAHTSEEKKAEIEAKRQEREAGRGGGQASRLSALRAKTRRNRG